MRKHAKRRAISALGLCARPGGGYRDRRGRSDGRHHQDRAHGPADRPGRRHRRAGNGRWSKGGLEGGQRAGRCPRPQDSNGSRKDTGCSAEIGIPGVKKAIHDHEVFMLASGGCSNEILSYRDIVLENGVPFSVWGATNDKITAQPNCCIFRTSLRAGYEGVLQADFARSIPNAERFAIIAQHDAWGQAKYDGVMNKLKEYGITPVADEEMTAETADATPQALRISKANPDVIITDLYPKPTTVFLRAAHQYGLHQASHHSPHFDQRSRAARQGRRHPGSGRQRLHGDLHAGPQRCGPGALEGQACGHRVRDQADAVQHVGRDGRERGGRGAQARGAASSPARPSSRRWSPSRASSRR